MTIEPATAALVLAAAVTLHNGEEMVWLPGFRHPDWLPQMNVSAFAFRFAACLVTAMVWLVAIAMVAGWRTEALMAGFAIAMLFNAALPHLVLTLILRRYHPGTATALLAVVPSVILFGLSIGDLALAATPSFAAGLIAGVVLLALLVPAGLLLGTRVERCRTMSTP